MVAIKNGLVYDAKKGFEDKNILTQNGIIGKIGDEIGNSSGEVIDASGHYVVPGFIDIHTHGANGVDTMSATYNALNSMSVFYASRGVTGFLPTTTTAPIGKIVQAVGNIKETIRRGTSGARILGVNLEGPFINREYKGSQREEFIIHPSLQLMDHIIDKSGGCIKIVTLAPEVEGAKELVEYLRGRGIIYAIGHSSLNYDNALEAFSRGISHVTHLFNAMMGIHHREPGLVGAAMDSENATVEIIADGIHVYPSIIRMVVKCKTPARTALVTDSTAASGLKDGEHMLGEQEVVIRRGEARLKRSGVLAGSTLTMIDAVRNMALNFKIPLEDAIKMAAVTPAKVIKMDDKKGSIAEGKDADIVILDKALNVKMTMVEGKIVYRS